jgi:Na+/H+-dicarboxylate symporter
MLDKLRKMKLSTKIGIAMLAGSVLGIVIGPAAEQIKFIGDIWLSLIKMVIIPMVIFIVVKGISTMDSPKTLGRIGLKIALFYAFTTVFATLIGIIVTSITKPGIGFQFEKATEAFKTTEILGIKEYIASLFSSNMFVSFYDGNMMQVLVIAIIIGIAVVCLEDKYRIPVKAWFDNMAELCMSLVELVMKLSPIGVFCLMASSLGVYGLETFGNMARMLGAFYLSCLLQVLIIYLGLLWITTKTSPLQFLKKSIPTWVTAVSTCSSAAVIPVNLKVSREEFDVSDQISSFSIPFGAQFNQDGGAILSAVVILFSAQAIGVNFGIMQLIQMVLVCTLVSAGSGAIPGGGIVRLMITSAAFGMPLEIVGLVAAFYRFFDMGTTSMSVIGDLSATVLVDRLEKRRTVKVAKDTVV